VTASGSNYFSISIPGASGFTGTYTGTATAAISAKEGVGNQGSQMIHKLMTFQKTQKQKEAVRLMGSSAIYILLFGGSRSGKSFIIIRQIIIRALKEFPSQNVYYEEVDGKPAAVSPANINFGLAIDIPKPDGTRALLVPNIKKAQRLNFAEYLNAYEDLVKRARDNKLTAEDFAGTTASLTNPGGIGTVHSVPRLTKGQGCIIGAGALDYPAEFQGMSEDHLAKLGVSKVITLTSTYDHRVIQGAGSGEFLRKIHELLLGERGFYDEIFADLRIPYEPIRWATDFEQTDADSRSKETRVQELINAYRVRGHLMADIDPLEYQQRSHPDLDVLTHGLSLWDLDRTYKTGGFGGKSKMMVRDVLKILRDSYCRTVGVEYMHIHNPAERKWMQDHLEVPYVKPTRDAQLRILEKLNEAEAFETFKLSTAPCMGMLTSSSQVLRVR
jgi:2-oxoglutarate dehydrogenase E1 component